MNLFEINMPYGARIYQDNQLVFFNRLGNPLGVAGETLGQEFVLEMMGTSIDTDPHSNALEDCQCEGTAPIMYRDGLGGVAYREVIFYTEEEHPLSSPNIWQDYHSRLREFFSLLGDTVQQPTSQLATDESI